MKILLKLGVRAMKVYVHGYLKKKKYQLLLCVVVQTDMLVLRIGIIKH